MQQQEKLQTAIVDANGQTLLLQAEQNQMPASIMQHPGSTTLLLQHAALIQQPNSHVEARLHPHQTQQHHQNSLELQPVSLLEQQMERQIDGALHHGRTDHEHLILLQNAVDDATSSGLDPSNIKVQVYSIL